MSLQDSSKARSVRVVHNLEKPRMLLELKRDGRKLMRKHVFWDGSVRAL